MIQTKLKNLESLKDLTYSERRQVHKMLDDLELPRGPLEERVDLLGWRYPEYKDGDKE